MRRILVVDDDRHTRLAIGIWLKQCGFRVAIADGGESGLTALNDGTFDLMMVDVFMPNMRGFESIRVFHSHAPTVPLIAISVYAFSGRKRTIPPASGWRSASARRGACASRSGRRRCSA
jgi:CheY-like chemotaxis protein